MATVVSQLMTQSVKTVHQDMEVHELEKMFLAEKIHGAPVVDDAGRLVGVVSQTDLLTWHFETGVDYASGVYEKADLRATGGRSLRINDIRSARVREVMTPVVHAILPGDTAQEAARRMIRHRIHRLVVVDSQLHVLGIVSAIDLLPLIGERPALD
ncbi:MAG: CBS domain-containing protein [Acidobacteria bacterium]|nr:CBS domain-containing protein [Acidobacteriota bacterium]